MNGRSFHTPAAILLICKTVLLGQLNYGLAVVDAEIQEWGQPTLPAGPLPSITDCRAYSSGVFWSHATRPSGWERIEARGRSMGRILSYWALKRRWLA